MRATTVGDSPCSTSSTARRRRRSSSAAVPLGLIRVLYARPEAESAFSHAGLSNPKRQRVRVLAGASGWFTQRHSLHVLDPHWRSPGQLAVGLQDAHVI